MRILYFILYVILPYSLRLFYSKLLILNNPKKYLGRTIYVSNHSASFMDPLVIGGGTRPTVFFMTRADIFTPLMKPILWGAHMLPIYRQQDGVNTKNKNEEVFEECARILKYGRNLLIFGEGFTDDVFVRRLKPLKKGALRIGLGALKYTNWSKKIYIQTVGINYGNPNTIGSEILVSYGKKICLNDYKEQLLNNTQQTVSNLTEMLEQDLQSQLTHVEEYDWAFFHEDAMRIMRLGLHPFDHDRSISLYERWKNSKSFANWINNQNLTDEDLLNLKSDLEKYFQDLNQLKIADTVVKEATDKKENIFLKKLRLFLLFPFTILGYIHNYIPYRSIKNFVEKSFKRSVFWGSVKMMLGVVAIGIWNIPICIGLHYMLIKPLCVGFEKYAWILSFVYFLITPIFGAIAYHNHRIYQNIKAHQNLKEQLINLSIRRLALKTRVQALSFFRER